jgi:hypothetical protein
VVSVRAGTSLLALLLLSLSAAIPAQAALSQKGNLFVRFDGGISPKALPRHERVPISVHLEGTIRQIGGDHPPGLTRMKVALNRAGQIESQGLPVCREGQIRGLSTEEAIKACGPSLVGSGGYTVITSLAGQEESVKPGELLLFNGKDKGQSAILVHAYQTEPVPISRLFVFRISHRAGTYGTVIDANVPGGLSRHGYLKSIYLDLQRSYSYRGERRSYLSASCAAPAGFSQALFPFAHASMSFDDGRTLSSVVSRTCRVG